MCLDRYFSQFQNIKEIFYPGCNKYIYFNLNFFTVRRDHFNSTLKTNICLGFYIDLIWFNNQFFSNMEIPHVLYWQDNHSLTIRYYIDILLEAANSHYKWRDWGQFHAKIPASVWLMTVGFTEMIWTDFHSHKFSLLLSVTFNDSLISFLKIIESWPSVQRFSTTVFYWQGRAYSFLFILTTKSISFKEQLGDIRYRV